MAFIEVAGVIATPEKPHQINAPEGYCYPFRVLKATPTAFREALRFRDGCRKRHEEFADQIPSTPADTRSAVFRPVPRGAAIRLPEWSRRRPARRRRRRCQSADQGSGTMAWSVSGDAANVPIHGLRSRRNEPIHRCRNRIAHIPCGARVLRRAQARTAVAGLFPERATCQSGFGAKGLSGSGVGFGTRIVGCGSPSRLILANSSLPSFRKRTNSGMTFTTSDAASSAR